MAALWYILTLWTGSAEELKALETNIVHYLWAGDMDTVCHKVKLNTMELPKDRGDWFNFTYFAGLCFGIQTDPLGHH